ncbi:MAG: radical SAM protein [Acidobacteriota bacterium]
MTKEKLKFPFYPLQRSKEVESVVIRGDKRLYSRFRPAPYYGGIATADALGCPFLCAYCWNYNRNLHPERYQNFYSPRQVASKLLSISQKKSFRLFRISGAEPILGEKSLDHLKEVLTIIHKNRPDSLFILETNGFFLGHRPGLSSGFKIFPNLRIRICLKGVDPESFERITGAQKDYFSYPIKALKQLKKLGISVWPALMKDLFSSTDIKKLKKILEKAGVESKIELESLEAYPFVIENMKKRGVLRTK